MPRHAAFLVVCTIGLGACGSASESSRPVDESATTRATSTARSDIDALPVGTPKLDCGSDLESMGVLEPSTGAQGERPEEALWELLRATAVLAPLAVEVPAELTMEHTGSGFRLAGRAEAPAQVLHVALEDRDRVIGVFDLTGTADGRWLGTSYGFCYETVRGLTGMTR